VRLTRILLCLLAVGLCAACAYVPPQQTSIRRVSHDYTATGGLEDARAYVYGNVTLLEFDRVSPFSVIIRDEAGAAVAYEKMGRYYRLARILDKFTVWANGHSATFVAPMTTRIFSAPEKTTIAVNVQDDPVHAIDQTNATESEAEGVSPEDEAITALIRLSKDQLAQARRLFDATSKNPKATGQELFDVNQYLNKVEANLLTAATATVRVSFPTGSTTFRPDTETTTTLITVGKSAEKIIIRGRTDARVAGPADPGIAFGRAMAARKFFIEKGINPEKIKVFSKADGAFHVPNIGQESRMMNRRVEIEIFNPRIAELINNLLPNSSAKNLGDL